MIDFDPKKYWEDRLAQNYDLEGVGCLGLGVNFNRWLYRVRSIAFSRVLRNLPIDISKASVIDIGSGTGFYLNEWMKHNPRFLAGSDIAITACDNLRKKFKATEIYHLDIGALDFQNPRSESFDIASAFDVLFHIVDDAAYYRAFKNIAGMLSPDGFLIFSDNFIHGREIRLEHFVSRSFDKIENALHDAGFELLNKIPMFKLMNIPLDNPSKFREFLWRRIKKYASKSEMMGNMIGAILYPIETMLILNSSESASTEIAIARKKRRN